MGSGAFFGVLVLLSSQILEDAQTRVVQERGRLARATARLLETRLINDMSRLTDAASLFVQPHGHSAQHESHGVVLAHATAHTAFKEGAFVLDKQGRALTSAPGPISELEALPDLPKLIERVRHEHRMVISSLVHLGHKPVLIAVGPVPHDGGPLQGFVVALFQPAATDLLKDLRDEGTRGRAEVALTDREGNVVASTDRQRILGDRRGDEVLCATGVSGQDPDGACVQCRPGDTECEPAVMAFASLPTLQLGLSVVQAHAIALAPAEALQRRLWTLGGALIVLFVVFNLLAVRSVVRPVTRLTSALRQASHDAGPLPHLTFASDEVGELAEALVLARSRVLESLGTAKESQRALRRERDGIRAHLETLQTISDASTQNDDLEIFGRQALEAILAACHARGGALELTHGSRRVLAQDNLTVLTSGRAVEQIDAAARSGASTGDCLPLDPAEPSDGAWPLLGRALRPAHGPQLRLVVAPSPDRGPPESLWLESMLQHTAVCAAHMLLTEANQARHAQQALFLRRVMKAQEDERSRVARELHDTVAQDLAALRLAIERASNHTTEALLEAELHMLEGSAQDMLTSVRRILLDLRLSVLDNLGLVPSLKWLLDRSQRAEGLRTHFVLDGDERPVDYLTSVSLFRITQEALQNIEQHAGADHVFLTVRFTTNGIELLVEDDGQGFDPQALTRPGASPDGHGLGLLGIRERAALVGGDVELSSAPGEGTSLRVRVPVVVAPVAGDVPLEVS